MDSEIPLYPYINQAGNRKKVLRFSSREMCEDMNTLGGVRGKSLILEFPKYLSKELIPHLFAGILMEMGVYGMEKERKW